jgi:KAP family P-loop domain
VAFDAFDFKTYAEALAAIIDDEATDTPLTIAISAPWGAGKTSLANLVIERLRELRSTQRKPQHVICRFDAWMHEDAPHLGAALAADVARVVNRKRPPWRRLLRPLPGTMQSPYQRWWRRIALALVVLAVVWIPAVWKGGREFYGSLVSAGKKDTAAQLGSAGSIALLGFGVLSAWSWLMAIAGKAARFVDAPGSEASIGSMQDVRSQLGCLISQATRRKRRLVIFVDDLERCVPKHALDACRVVSQLVGHPDVVTVLLADMTIVRRAAPGGRLYLQKLIQLEFALPPVDADGMARMMARRAGGAPAGGWLSSIRERARAALRTSSQLARVIAGAVFILALAAAMSALIFHVSVGIVAIGFFLVLSLPPVIGRVLLERHRERVQKIDNALLRELAGSNPTIDELVASLEPLLGPDELIRQRAQRFFTDESALLRQSESELLAYLPVPRSVKRALNQLRVLLVVADGRHMLGPGRQLQRGHLWKWVVLGERWPELAEKLVAEPEWVKQLERASSPKKLEKSLGSEMPHDDLYEFLQRPPKLGPVVRRLIRFQPTPGAARDGAAAAS